MNAQLALMEAGLLTFPQPRLERSTNRHWLLSDADLDRWMKASKDEKDLIIRVDDLPMEVRRLWDRATTNTEKKCILEKYESLQWEAGQLLLDFDEWDKNASVQWEQVLVEPGILPLHR